MNTTLRLWDGYPHTSPTLAPVVRDLQQLLTARGIETYPDGLYGPGTEESVRRFQAGAMMRADGVAGPRTWAALAGKTLDVAQFETTYLAADVSLRAQEKVARRYSGAIKRAADTARVSSAVICGIASRESAWGLALRPPGAGGTGDWSHRATPKGDRAGALPPDGGGFGRGLMQIDYDAHAFARTGAWRDGEQNLLYGATVLLDNLRLLRRRFPGFGEGRILAAALAAYNCGPRRVVEAMERERDVDYFTTHRDYSRDVLSRAGWFQMQGWYF